MKKLITLLLIILSAVSYAQTGSAVRKNAVTDLGNGNLSGNGKTDETDNLRNAIIKSSRRYKLYLPAGVYRITEKIGLPDSIDIAGAGMGKTIIFLGKNLKSRAFELNGGSSIRFADLTLTQDSANTAHTNHGTRMDAVFQLSSYTPGKQGNISSDLRFERVEVKHVNCVSAWSGPYGSPKDTSFVDKWVMRYCRIQGLRDPAHPVVQTENPTYQCRGVNLQQCTLRFEMDHCTIDSTTGDNLTGYGRGVGGPDNKLWGNWYIHDSYFAYGWMNIEINGQSLGYNLRIDKCTIKYSQNDYGFNVSIDGENARLTNCKIYGVDRNMLEFTGLHSKILNNTFYWNCHTRSSGGTPVTKKAGGPEFFMNLYGYDNEVAYNKFFYDGTGKNATSPDKVGGFILVGDHTEPRGYQPQSWAGHSNPNTWNIHDNIWSGINWRLIESQNPFDLVTFKKNTIVTPNLVGNTDLIQAKGHKWLIDDNTFDLSRSSGANGNLIIREMNRSNDPSGNTVPTKRNKIIGNSSWSNQNFLFTAPKGK